MDTVGISESRRLQGLGTQPTRGPAARDRPLSTARPGAVRAHTAPLRSLRSRRRRQGDRRRPAGGGGPSPVVEPLVDDAGPARPGEPSDAYVFVDRATFEQGIRDGGFFEWAEFLGNLYGTPLARSACGTRRPAWRSTSRERCRFARLRPDATLILLLPPPPRPRPSACGPGETTKPASLERVQAGREEERRGREHRRRRGGQRRGVAGRRGSGRYSGTLPSWRLPRSSRCRRRLSSRAAEPSTRGREGRSPI